MANHFHLVIPVEEGARERLGALLGNLRGWPYRPPGCELAADRVKVRRDVRYAVLNPCRAGLCGDPLEWLWSTHRELVGGVRDPWVDVEALRRLGVTHRYVSGDPSVAVTGTPSPVAARLGWDHGLGRIAAAAMAACRATPAHLRRRTEARTVFLQLAARNGWRRASMLARSCDIQRAAVHRAWAREDVTREAQLCLGDDRLLACIEPRAPQGYEPYP